jgi:hypothetical protein
MGNVCLCSPSTSCSLSLHLCHLLGFQFTKTAEAIRRHLALPIASLVYFTIPCFLAKISDPLAKKAIKTVTISKRLINTFMEENVLQRKCGPEAH